MIDANEQLHQYLGQEPIRSILAKKTLERQEPRYQPLQDAVDTLQHLPISHCNLDSPEIQLGHHEDLDAEQRKQLMQSLSVFKPWKKGPFRIFGEAIDAEWQSDWKWGRIVPHCPDLRNKVIADIGCHNGYYMFRMAPHQPRLVVGFEPVIKLWYNFDLLQSLAKAPNLHFTPLGVEHIDSFPGFFDVVFCLGILYHHRDPIGLLEKMRSALAPGGSIIIDCQGVQHDESIALMPKNSYAGTVGTWFLPSLPCLLHWVQRSGFSDAVCFYQAQVSELEQRSTAWAPVKSLKDFLSPIDRQRTVEGYPRPWRFYIRAKK